MRPEYWAVLTAICWAIGSALEKVGVKAGNFTPIMGLMIRTYFSLLVLSFISYRYWGEIKKAQLKDILYIIIGGGIIAGVLGLSFLYTAIKHGSLTSVLTVAFCLTPVIGTIIGYLFLAEKMTAIQLIGILLCVSGAVLTVYNRDVAHH